MSSIAKIVCTVLVLLTSLLSHSQAQTLTVGGTGSSMTLMRLLFDAFQSQYPQAVLNVVSPPLGSGGAMRALKAGQIDLAVVARPLKAEEASSAWVQFKLADSPLVFATSDGLRPKGFTLNELASVYNGELKQWDSGEPIRLVLRATFESDTLEIRAMSAALAIADGNARKRPGMQMGNDDLDTLALLTQTPASLGPTTLGLLHTSGSHLHILPINGEMPSLATLKDGRYPWHKLLTVVLAPNASPLALSFAQFLRSSKASTLLLNNDYLPQNR
jgi:phosphate transport system substrate-binding protein